MTAMTPLYVLDAVLVLFLWQAVGHLVREVLLGRAAGQLLGRGRSYRDLYEMLSDAGTRGEILVEAARRHPLLSWSVQTTGCGCQRCRKVRWLDRTRWVGWAWPLWARSYSVLLYDVLEERTRPWSVEEDEGPEAGAVDPEDPLRGCHQE